LRDPASLGIQVAFPTKAALVPVTDGYFRGYDNKFPDFYRVKEWEREFNQFERDGNLPNLELVRVMHDPHGKLRQRDRWREHAGYPDRRQRLRGRVDYRQGVPQPSLQEQHADFRDRRRLTGRSRSC